jgi:glycosyltransferase involved in cell wall biosynthesis
MKPHGGPLKILLTYRRLMPDSYEGPAFFCGGAQKIASALAVHMSRQGWQVYFASDDRPAARNVQYLCAHGVAHVRIPFDRHTKVASSLVRLWRLAKTERINLIHCHDRRSVLAGAIVGRWTGIPMVYTAHNAFPDKYFTRVFFGHHIVAVSEAVRQNLEQVFRRPRDRLRLIYNGVEVGPSDAEQRRALREEWGLRPQDRIISMVGRLTEQKGHRYLLEALPLLVRAYPELRVLFVGDGPLRRPLAAAIVERHLDAHVILCGNQANAPLFMEISEFTVAPSLWEGLPLAVVESLCLGVPVVASAIACHREIVTHGNMGLLVPPKEPGALAEAILFMLQHHEEVRQMGQRCSQVAGRNFSLPRMLAQYEAYYDEVLHRPAALNHSR